MTTVEILFCRENLKAFGDEVLRQLEQANRPELNVRVAKCIIACGECGSMPIARVNGQLLAAPVAEQLLNEIKQVVKQITDA